MSKQECLFIGGDHDGRTIEVEVGVKYVQLPVLRDGEPGFGALRYRREQLRMDNRIYFVFVVDDIPGADVIGRLIAGYGNR